MIKLLKFVLVFLILLILFSVYVVGITNDDPETDHFYGRRIQWEIT